MRAKEWLELLGALIFIVADVYLELKLPDYMSDITKLVETPNSSMHDVWVAGGKMMVMACAAMICVVIAGFFTAYAAASFTQYIRSEQFKKVESFGLTEINHFSTSSLITRSTNDVTQVQMFITMGVTMLVKSPIMAVWAICKIAGKGMEWTVATSISVIFLLICISVLMYLVLPKFKSMQTLTDNINRVAREQLTGLRVVRAYNAEDYQQKKFDVANDDLTSTQLFTNRAMAVMMPVMSTTMNGLTLAVYWIGAYLINSANLADKLTLFSNMIIFSSYATQVIMSFLLLSIVFVLWPRADVSAKRILEVLNTKISIKNGTKTQGLKDSNNELIKGEVEFKNMSFAYPDSRKPILENISFTAKQGETVAFIGATGSSKTSLINLVPRFYDVTEGSVLVDGVDVKEYDEQALRKKIGYVSQRSTLFKGTIASNIAFGADVNNADGSDNSAELTSTQMQSIEQAGKVAQADPFIQELDKCYDSDVAQGGSNYSGGQKQRISIARAVWRNPEILIFDDSFSALDYKTDHEVRQALAQYAQESTKLIVAQRVGTIMQADRIIVLDHGHIVGQGTHKELLENCKIYKEIAESQLSEQELAH